MNELLSNKQFFQKIQLIQDVACVALLMCLIFFLVGSATSFVLACYFCLDLFGVITPVSPYVYACMIFIILFCAIAISGIIKYEAKFSREIMG